MWQILELCSRVVFADMNPIQNRIMYFRLQITTSQLILQIPIRGMMFRGIIINYVGVIPQGILFGLFHTAAYYSIYGLNIPAMLSAMVLGIAFGYVVKTFPKRGIAVTWGVHAAWNIAILIPIFSLHFLL